MAQGEGQSHAEVTGGTCSSANLIDGSNVRPVRPLPQVCQALAGHQGWQSPREALPPGATSPHLKACEGAAVARRGSHARVQKDSGHVLNVPGGPGSRPGRRRISGRGGSCLAPGIPGWVEEREERPQASVGVGGGTPGPEEARRGPAGGKRGCWGQAGLLAVLPGLLTVAQTDATSR